MEKKLSFGDSDQSWNTKQIALFIFLLLLFYPLVQIWALLPLTNVWERWSVGISIWMSRCKWAALVCDRNGSWRGCAFWLESKYTNIWWCAGKWITVFGLSVWHFLCHSSSWRSLYWNAVIGVKYYRGTAMIITLKSCMFLWSNFFVFLKCCSLSSKKSWKSCKECREIKPGIVKDFQYHMNIDPLKSQIIFLFIHCRIRPLQDKTQQCCGVGI